MTFFECYPDETFLSFLGFKAKALSGGHAFGRSNVARKLSKNQNSFALVDEDPGSPCDDYLKSVFSGNPLHEDGAIRCFHDKKNDNIIIVLRPNLEAFIVQLARGENIDLSSQKYRLSMKSKELHSMLTPRSNVSQRKKFREFLDDVSANSSLKKLKEIIKN